MSTLKTIKKGLVSSTDIYPDSYRGQYPSGGGQWFFGQNGFDLYFSYNGHESSLKAYKKCPPLSAVINKKAQAFMNGKVWVMNSSGKAKAKEATNEAGVKIRNLLNRPNPLQNRKMFEAQAYSYCQLCGYSLILLIKPVGFGAIDSKYMWNIPPSMVDIEETEKLFAQNGEGSGVKKIVLRYKNVTTRTECR
jgi:hypothetical protein